MDNQPRDRGAPEIHAIAHGARADAAWVNCHDVFAAIPFGGYKQSGLGRERDEYGLAACAKVKTVTIKP